MMNRPKVKRERRIFAHVGLHVLRYANGDDKHMERSEIITNCEVVIEKVQKRRPSV